MNPLNGFLTHSGDHRGESKAVGRLFDPARVRSDWPFHRTYQAAAGIALALQERPELFASPAASPRSRLPPNHHTGHLQGLPGSEVRQEQGCRRALIATTNPPQVAGRPRGGGQGNLGHWHCQQPGRRLIRARPLGAPFAALLQAPPLAVVLPPSARSGQPRGMAHQHDRSPKTPARSPGFGASTALNTASRIREMVSAARGRPQAIEVRLPRPALIHSLPRGGLHQQHRPPAL